MWKYECYECGGFADIEHSRYCSECSADICEGCRAMIPGLAEAYAHDDDADRLCDKCVAKVDAYVAAQKLRAQSAGGAQ